MSSTPYFYCRLYPPAPSECLTQFEPFIFQNSCQSSLEQLLRSLLRIFPPASLLSVSFLSSSVKRVIWKNYSPSGPIDFSRNGLPAFAVDFTVHIFVNHDPFIASAFLPELFARFPDSPQRLPAKVPPPDRPEASPTSMPQVLLRELYVDPRKGLGRHVVPEPISSSTTLRTLSSTLEREFWSESRPGCTFYYLSTTAHIKQTVPEQHDLPLLKLMQATSQIKLGNFTGRTMN